MIKLGRDKEIYNVAIKNGDAATTLKITLLITYEEQKLTNVLEKAPKDLDSPLQHEWKHGDVFLNEHDVIMILILPMTVPGNSPRLGNVFCISGQCDCAHKTRDFLDTAKFLFNIKEKL